MLELDPYEGDQDTQSQNTPLRHKDYFELKAAEAGRVLCPPLFLLKAGHKFAFEEGVCSCPPTPVHPGTPHNTRETTGMLIIKDGSQHQDELQCLLTYVLQ